MRRGREASATKSLAPKLSVQPFQILIAYTLHIIALKSLLIHLMYYNHSYYNIIYHCL